MGCGRLEDRQFLWIERLQVSGYGSCGLKDRQEELFFCLWKNHLCAVCLCYLSYLAISAVVKLDMVVLHHL